MQLSKLIRPLFSLPVALAVLGAAALTAPTPARAQTGKELVGTWTLVSLTYEKDGVKTDGFGPSPKGQIIFEGNGHFSTIFSKSDLPKFASNTRTTGTPEENKAVVQGSIAYFGTYTVNEPEKSFTVHVDTCTLPNWNGTDQKRNFTLSGDELTILNPTASTGGSAKVVLKRAK